MLQQKDDRRGEDTEQKIFPLSSASLTLREKAKSYLYRRLASLYTVLKVVGIVMFHYHNTVHVIGIYFANDDKITVLIFVSLLN